MIFARMREVVSALILATTAVIVVEDCAAKDEPAAMGVRCCGLLMRTNFGHPERMVELAIQPDSVLGDCIDSGKAKGLVEAFDAYLEAVEKEFGDAARRDVVRSRLNKVFKSVASDPTRTATVMEGFRRFVFAKVLASKGLNTRAIEEVRQSRATFLRAVPPESFCILPVELYLATALAENQQSAEAVSIAQGIVTRARKVYGDHDEFVGMALGVLGKAQLSAGKLKEAEQALRESLGILAESPEIQPNAYLINCNLLAETMLAQSKHAEAAELLAYLDPQMRKLFKDYPLMPPVFETVTMRAKALVALRRFDQAETVLGRYPEQTLSLKDPGIAGRNLLEVYVTVLEGTDRADQTQAAKKCIARLDAKFPVTTRR